MSKIILPLKALKAASTFVSKEETRYYVGGVFFEFGTDGTLTLVATDGHRLGAFRMLEGKFAVEGDAPESFILPTATIAALCKIKCKKKEYVWVCLDLDDWVAYAAPFVFDKAETPAAMIKKESELQIKFAPIDGFFPDWRRIVPRAKAFEPAAQRYEGFNAAYLAAFAALSDSGIVTLFMNNYVGSPSVLCGSESLFWSAFGVLMPCGTHTEDALPKWFTGVAS